MSFRILLQDEFRGYFKSKFAPILMIGMPLLTFIIYWLQPDTEGIPLSFFIGLLISSISGTLSAVMIATSLVQDRQKQTFDLFLIRPVKRWQLIVVRPLAVFISMITVAGFCFILGYLVDLVNNSVLIQNAWQEITEGYIISIAAMAIACSLGTFIGLITENIMISAVLSIYLGGQFTSLAVLPAIFFENIPKIPYALGVSIPLTVIIMLICIKLFQKKIT